MRQQSQRRPGRNNECDDQREQHRGRSTHGDRPHVRAHQSAHKGHGQNGGNHSKGRQNGGIADFVHGFDGDVDKGSSTVLRQAEVANDVLNNDNGVVDQNADREDQRKQRDAIEGVAKEVEDEQRERQGDRNSEQHHARFAPAEREGNQQRHRERRQEQVLQQFVGFVFRRLAVIAGDGDVQVLGDQKAM